MQYRKFVILLWLSTLLTHLCYVEEFCMIHLHTWLLRVIALPRLEFLILKYHVFPHVTQLLNWAINLGCSNSASILYYGFIDLYLQVQLCTRFIFFLLIILQ